MSGLAQRLTTVQCVVLAWFWLSVPFFAQGGPGAGAENRSKVLPFGHEILKLYEAGKLVEARSALVRLARQELQAFKRISGTRPIDLEGRLGIGVVARLLVQCFALEPKFTSRSPVPLELVDISGLVLSATDEALEQARNAADLDEHRRNILASTEGDKQTLILALIRGLRDSGDKEGAHAIARRHAAFLRDRGVRIEDLLSGPTAPDATKRKTQ